MPSQKHKKKKKSHKARKKHRSSSRSTDGKGLEQPKTFLNSDSGSSEDEDKLTCLVRKSYMNHLQQALLQNFESCSEISDLHSSVQEMVHSWSLVLEKKALEESTVSELYRKNMVSLIKYITASTKDKSLCIKDQHFSQLSSELLMNKETQTEKMDTNDGKGNIADAELQTDILMRNSFSKEDRGTFCNRPYSRSISQNCITDERKLQQSEPSPTNQDDISSTSDFLDTLKLNMLKRSDCDPTNAHGPLNIPVSSIYGQANAPLSEYCDSKPMDINFVATHNDNDSDSTQEHNTVVVKNNEKNTSKDCLDKRLYEMGLFNEIEEESENKQLHLIACKKSNWFAEEIAQSCNFTRIFLGMSIKQQKRVLKKIKAIFGNEEEPLSELTENNITVCRKRIATIVVMELTPMYQAKKIASRQLFKFLAKKITNSLLDQSYAPDSKSIRQKVKDFFSGGRVITSESDCC